MCMRVTACMRILFSCMFFESAQRGCDGEGSLVSAVTHTKKIKLLMAWVSSNGTLSCFMCVCACINKAAFKASLIHGCITAFRPGLSLSFLFTAPSLCPYMWASIHLRLLFPGCRAAPISLLRTDERSTLLLWRPCTHIYHTKSLL